MGDLCTPDLGGGTEALVRHSAVTADWLPVSNGELTASRHFAVVGDEGSRGSRVNVSGRTHLHDHGFQWSLARAW
jgi:hypothetical protein